MILFLLFMMENQQLESVWELPVEKLGIYGNFPDAPHQLAVAGDGAILIHHPSERRLLFLDADGNLKHSAGGSGNGPGEFAIIQSIGWDAATDSWFVSDGRAPRITKYGRDGTLAETITVDRMRGPVYSDHGRVFFMQRAKTSGHYHLSSFDLSKKEYSVLYTRDMELRPFQPLMPWNAMMAYACGAEFVAVNHGNYSDVLLLDYRDGKQLGQFKLEVPRVELTRDYIQEYVAAIGNTGPKGGGSIADNIEAPEYWPYAKSLLIDEQNRIWVFLHRKRQDDPSAFYVMNRQGEPRFQGSFQGEAQDIRGPYLYILREDDQENEVLGKLAIP